MRKFYRLSMIGIICSAAMMAASVSSATTVLTFEGVGDQCAVNDFYNGGTDSCGHSGVNHGVNFSSSSLAIIDSDAGGGGNIANEPSASTVLFFLSGGAATMNVASGFNTGFSFYYSASTTDTFVSVWSGLNGTGDLLSTLNLNANYAADNCSGDPTGIYCHWDPIGVLFDGIAHSVNFGGTANYVAFDDITLGSDNPGGGGVNVPEPAALGMFGLGVLLIGLFAGLRRRFV
ncbi:PEP-CTERM sorting domain-containing protein [Rhodanobacter sp. AS-Z3]|uniref:PEP-CTERM sorting domain-containing protein n=1 Tax=Rhodanobacter sp. AS-Z3 TaxID=3031330 RepID=UPI002478C3BD|nr:PEP-CTERM sorting domain-containing protein [Rhodanobacter sp. AS-Z3]WEN14286.1 PEP-CTERM sorting domain-containing protein [Rhodanobacter sp. AS-Z3]